MLFTKILPNGDEEALSPLLPSSVTSTSSEPTTAAPTRCRKLLRLLLSVLHQLLTFTIPSFLKRKPSVTSNLSEEEPWKTLVAQKRHPTEYLDGVRGLASFIVFLLHWTHIQYPGINSGYGTGDNTSIWQLPMIRLLYSGAAMVSIFFVVSGHVLTRRFVQHVHQHEYESLFASLTSLAFRRAIRLFLPSLISCLLVYICASFNLVELPKKAGEKKSHHSLKALMNYLDSQSNPWTWNTSLSYGRFQLSIEAQW